MANAHSPHPSYIRLLEALAKLSSFEETEEARIAGWLAAMHRRSIQLSEDRRRVIRQVVS